MKPSDTQQAIAGFRTIAVLGGPYVVRVHEALDACLSITRHRYFISVDFKFKRSDALNIGKPGWLGISKTEATKEANQLASHIAITFRAMTAANEHALQWDTFTNRHTAKLQEQAFNKIVDRYSTGINPTNSHPTNPMKTKPGIETNHTPPPWEVFGVTQVCKMGKNWAHIAVISSPRGDGDPMANPTELRLSDSRFHEACANAQFIVKAVNTHAALIQERDRLREVNADLMKVLTDCLDTFSGETKYINGCSTRDMFDKIRAAILKAKGLA